MSLITDLEKNAELLSELDHLVLKQQLLISKAFLGGLDERNKKANAKRTEYRPRHGALPSGCRVRMWKQDPSVKEVPIRLVFLPTDVDMGPSDRLINVSVDNDQKTKSPVLPDQEGDMQLDFEKDPFAFDLVQAYSVVRLVVNMYQRDLHMDWKWQWDKDVEGGARTPITINCHAGERMNASYIRSKKMLKFYYFKDDEKRDIYLCRSLDIVAHETGHAIMDSLKPELYSITQGQQGALHEAFADLTAIFVTLSQLDMCEDVMANTKGDLRASKYLSSIGEEFGQAINETPFEDPADDEPEHQSVARGVRDCNNKILGSEATDTYELAGCFAGYIYDILCDVFDHERNPRVRDDAETLLRVARILRRILLLSLYNTTATPDFLEVSKAMEHSADIVVTDDEFDVDYWKGRITKYRVDRELEIAGKRDSDFGMDYL